MRNAFPLIILLLIALNNNFYNAQIDTGEFAYNGQTDMLWFQLIFGIIDFDFDNKNDSITYRSYANKATNDKQPRKFIWGYDLDFSENGSEYELIETYEQWVTLDEDEFGLGHSILIKAEKNGKYTVTWFIQTNQTDPSTRIEFIFDAPNLSLYNETLRTLYINSNPDITNSEIFNEMNFVDFTIPIWINSSETSSDLDLPLKFISVNQFIGLGFILILGIIIYLLKRKH